MGFESKNYDLYYKLIEGIEIKKYDIGTYNMAQKSLDEFIKAYQKTHEKHWEVTLPPLHYLVDAAPLVYDLKEICNLQKTISILNIDLADGYKEQINNLHSYAEALKQYYASLPMYIELKQVDLVKECPLKHIHIQDIFYAWHCFGFLKKTKINNRVYWTKISETNTLKFTETINKPLHTSNTVKKTGCLLPIIILESLILANILL